MNLIKKISLGAGLLFIAIQFIRPGLNRNPDTGINDITRVVNVPDSVYLILKNSCYDCHSNNTIYPWYSNIQPGGWFLARHITHAKEELNFSEYGGYSARKQYSKFDAISNEIRDNGMPLPSYRLMHKDARLDQAEKTMLINWAESATSARGEGL